MNIIASIFAIVMFAGGFDGYIASSEPYGDSSATEFMVDPPVINETMALNIHNLSDVNITGMIFFGFAPTEIPTQWGTFYVYPTNFIAMSTWTVEPGGDWKTKFTVPNSQELLGVDIYLQAIGLNWKREPAFSNGVKIVFGY